MKRFDSKVELGEADAQYELRGLTFTRRDRVRPETMAQIEDAPYAATALGVVEMLDAGISGFLIDDDVPRWRELRDKTDDPVTLKEMRDVAEWLVEVETRLPTERPPVSTGGPSSTVPSSTEPSSSQEEIQAA